jgi:regulator-associated protein of mTOR
MKGYFIMQMVSASPAGDLKFLDMRKSSAPYLEVEALKGQLTSLAVHRHAPVIATGSGKQLIRTFSTEGEKLSMITNKLSYLGGGIGSVSALHFHPYKVLLAAGAINSIIHIYAGESIQGT